MVGSIDCVLTDLATTTLHATRIEIADQTPESMVAGCADAVAYLSKFAPQGAQITGVGVAMPGVIEAGVCHRSFRFGWSDVAIASMIAERLHVPVWVDDDTNAFALAQQLFGLGRHLPARPSTSSSTEVSITGLTGLPGNWGTLCSTRRGLRANAVARGACRRCFRNPRWWTNGRN
jgi:hypothetical protein